MKGLIMGLTLFAAAPEAVSVESTPEAYTVRLQSMDLSQAVGRQRLLEAVDLASERICADPRLISDGEPRRGCYRRASREIARKLPIVAQRALDQARQERAAS